LLLFLLLQLWNLPWWSCSAGSCVDRNIDEVAYIETVIKTILSKLSVDKSKVSLLQQVLFETGLCHVAAGAAGRTCSNLQYSI
jgi:hypothetical protein